MPTKNYQIERKIDVIREWTEITLELNVVKWGTGKPKYDLRRWNNGDPQKGVTLEKEDLEKLFYVIGEEIGYDFSKDKDEKTPEDGESSETLEEMEIDYRSFFVHGDMRQCDINGHDYKKIIARIPIYTGNKVAEIEVPAFHCIDCDAFYISEAVYNKVLSKGRLLCQLVSKDELIKYRKQAKFNELKPQGKLAIVGYNVGSIDNLSARHRQTILEYAIREGIVTKKEAISYLKFFIRLNEGKKSSENAIRKWNEDLNYLMGIDISNQRLVGVARIIR